MALKKSHHKACCRKSSTLIFFIGALAFISFIKQAFAGAWGGGMSCWPYASLIARRSDQRGSCSNRTGLGRQFVAIAATTIICGVLSMGGAPTRANDQESPDGPATEWRGHTELISSLPFHASREEINLVHASVAFGSFDDDPLAALRDFAQQIPEPAQSAAAAAPLKLAEADNAFDALREFFQKQNGSAPSEKPAAPVRPAAMPKAPLVAATYVGSKTCLTCHASQAEKFGYTLMGRLQKQGKLQCESCHGPGSEHVRVGGGRGAGGIISFRKNDTSRTVEDNNSICLGCHQRGERTYWTGSVHDTRGVACTDCHTLMTNVSATHQLKTAFEPETCFQCHKDRRAQMFRSAHMPMREGKVVCSDCHNPHGTVTEAGLREDSINDNCYRCHAEKRGPVLFEHAPVRENCLSCHNAHGSINQFSLKTSLPRLCYECHTIGHTQAGPNSPFTMSRACLNCHTQIHGSNSPAGAVFQR
jgi:DmsE family decaheme c-type cytochrome